MSRFTKDLSSVYYGLIWFCGWLLIGAGLHSLAQGNASVPGSPLSEQAQRTGPTHDVINEETLRKQAETAAKLSAPVASKTLPLTDTPPSTQSSLLSASILISDGANKFTIVPVGSVLVLPNAFRSRVLSKPQGELVLWPDFLKSNMSWLAAKEVSLEMSRGDTKAAAVVMRELSGENRLVVSVYKGGPITILEAPVASETQAGKKTGTP